MKSESRTVGLSPKAVLAFLFPLIAAIVGSLSSWAISGFGAFDTTSIVIAATGLGASGVALLGAYVGKPGKVVAINPAPATGLRYPPHAVPLKPSPMRDETSSSMSSAVVWNSPAPGMSMANAVPASPAEPAAPFTPDGEPDDGDGDPNPITQAPDESWHADPKDRHGAHDQPEGPGA